MTKPIYVSNTPQPWQLWYFLPLYSFYQQKKNMTLWKLFKASGVPMSTLAAFMSKRTELIKLDTLLHICEGFGITLTEFFQDDVFKEVEQD